MSPQSIGWTSEGSPFHEGEQDLQARTQMREEMERFARKVVHERMPEQHREFYRQLPFIMIGRFRRAKAGLLFAAYLAYVVWIMV